MDAGQLSSQPLRLVISYDAPQVARGNARGLRCNDTVVLHHSPKA